MRKIESEMLKCISTARSSTRRSNTQVIIVRSEPRIGGYVTLFGRTIATFDGPFFTLNDGKYRGATTKSRLNVLLAGSGYRISQTKFVWRLLYKGQDRGPFLNHSTFAIGVS